MANHVTGHLYLVSQSVRIVLRWYVVLVLCGFPPTQLVNFTDKKSHDNENRELTATEAEKDGCKCTREKGVKVDKK